MIIQCMHELHLKLPPPHYIRVKSYTGFDSAIDEAVFADLIKRI